MDLDRGSSRYVWKGIRKVLAMSPKKTCEELDQQGRLVLHVIGMPRLKRYLDEVKGIPSTSIGGMIFNHWFVESN